MLKRIFDLSFSALLFTLLLPLQVIIGVVLWVTQNGKVFFIQERPGLHGKIFRMYKFRTMRDGQAGSAAEESQRVTAVGRVLRVTSLDELPQLINVIKGDMSLVGPRPLLPEYLPLYSAHQMRRHEVRPGVTGWAQIQGRNNLTWPEKFEFDVWYVDNRSFMLDVKIMFLTAKKLSSREGISSKEHSISEPFDGS